MLQHIVIGSVVAILTLHGLDGRGIESRWGKIFRTAQTSPEAQLAFVQGIQRFPQG